MVVSGLPGDFNTNGVVDAADYVVWRNNVGSTTALPNDSIGGTIGTPQYNEWRTHFGQTAGSGAGVGANAAVPEPATVVMLILAAAGWCLWRGRAAYKMPKLSTPCKSAISSGCESHSAQRSLGRQQSGR